VNLRTLQKKTPYAAGVGVHKASTGFRNEKDDFQYIFQLSV
jgi:hypothetical protein